MRNAVIKSGNTMERRLGAAVGLSNVAANLGARLLLVPIMLHYLERSEFGLYQLIGAFVGYMALIDFGISGTLGRFIAKYQALKDRVRQDNVFAMCIIVYSFLSVVIAVIGYWMYLNLDVMFSQSLTAEEMNQARVMFVILLLSISATIISRAFIGVNAGHERFVFSRITESVCVLARIGVVTAVLAAGYRAIGIVAAEAIINIAILVLNAMYARMVLKVRFKLHHWDWGLFKEVIGFAFWTFLAALVLQLNFRLGSVLLGVMTSTGIVAVYAIALQINTLYNMLPTTISTVFLPRITRLVVKGADGGELTQTIISPSRYQLMLMGSVLGGFILFGRQFIALWAGSAYVGAWAAALAILIPVTVPLCQHTVLCILQAKMLNRDRALVTLIFAIISGVGSIFLIRPLGLFGPAFATGLGILLGHGIIMNIYYHYYVGLNMVQFFKKVCERILLTIFGAMVIGHAVNYLPLDYSWTGLAVKLSLFLSLYVFSMWIYGMNEGEKSFFRTVILNLVKGPFAQLAGEGKAK